jgi:hypothetical protein
MTAQSSCSPKTALLGAVLSRIVGASEPRSLQGGGFVVDALPHARYFAAAVEYIERCRRRPGGACKAKARGPSVALAEAEALQMNSQIAGVKPDRR